MVKINCNVARDIMTLCMDGLASADTKRLLDAHMEECAECRSVFQKLKDEVEMPVDETLRKESKRAFKKYKLRLRWQKLAALFIGMVLALAVAFVCMQVVQEVGVVHDFFMPDERVSIRNADYEAGWQALGINDGELRFDSVFWRKEVTSHTDSEGPVELRFLDERGDVCLDGVVVEPGCTVRLVELERNQVYKVEYRADGSFIFLTFR